MDLHGVHGRVIVHADLDCFYCQLRRPSCIPAPDIKLMTQHASLHHEYPVHNAADAHIDGDATVIADESLEVCAHFRHHLREFAHEAAMAVWARRRIHNGSTPGLDASVKGDALIEAAAAHVDLCWEAWWLSRVRGLQGILQSGDLQAKEIARSTWTEGEDTLAGLFHRGMPRPVGRGWRDSVGGTRGFRLAVGWGVVWICQASTESLNAVGVKDVEHTRLGIPTSTPLAVQQWDGLIAINYAARKFGVKRGDRTEAAKKKCPEIVFVHVETIGTGEDHRTVGAALPTTRDGGGAGRGGASGGASHDQRSCKVSLERYRVASFAIMAIFQNHCRRVERASIDEAYLDFTEEAAKLCQDAEAGEAPDLENAPETDLQGTAGHRVDPTNAFDRALLAGARLTAAMRLAVEEELGFTVSAGIASNKVLAKLASSRNKPNKQTVVPAGAASEMLDTVPLHNLRGLGGKLGELVGAWSKAETASDLKKFGQDELAAKFGPKTGVWLWRICRGMDDEAVTPNLKPKSLSVCKSFAPIRDRDGVLQWMKLLCQELAHRIGVDRGAWSRRATKLTLQIISSKQGDSGNATRGSRDGWRAAAYTRSRTVDIPGGTEAPSAEALVSEAMSVFDKTENTLPCNRLALTAHEFDSLVSGRGSIASFLRAAPTENKPAAATSSEMNSQEQLSSPSGEMNERCGTSTRSSPFSGKRRGSMHNSSENHGGGGALGAKMTTDAPAAVMAAAAGLTSESTVRVGDSESSSVAKAPRSTGEASLMSTMTSAVVVAATGREGAWGEDVWEGEERSPCTKCGVFIEAGLMPEHLDFHYAQDLQQRYSREGDVARDRASISRTSAVNHGIGGGNSSGEKRKREEGGGRGRGSTAVGGGVGRRTSTKAGNVGPTRRIDSFFKPL